MRVGFGHHWPVCGQSSITLENGRDSCRGAISESPTGSHQKFIVPGQGLPLGIASHCPRPLRGRGRRPEAGRGGGYEEGPTGSAACGEGARPLSCPHPWGDSHHGPQHGVRAWGIGCFPASSRSLCPMNAPHPFAIFRVIHARTRKIRCNALLVEHFI
jgi:hypothetical protein